MVQLSVRPMDSFRTAGRNTGPGAVIGQAIRGVLDHGRKLGLLKAQSGYQAQASNAVNLAKEARAETALGRPTSTIIAGETAAEDRVLPHTVGQKVMQRKESDPLRAILSKIIEDGDEDETVDTGLRDRASKWLELNGGVVHPANIQAVIDKGLVK